MEAKRAAVPSGGCDGLPDSGDLSGLCVKATCTPDEAWIQVPPELVGQMHMAGQG